jgi:hypothetical protein
MKLARPLALLVVLASLVPGANAATIQIQGVVTSSTGSFSTLINAGDSATASVTGLTAGPDMFASDSNVSMFSLLTGLLSLQIGSLPVFTADASVDDMTVFLNDVAEGSDFLQVTAEISGYSIRLDLIGSEAFLSSDAFPGAPGAINWSAFTSGTGYLNIPEDGGNNLLPSFGPSSNEIIFDVSNATDVPEPSTLAMIGIGGALIAFGRRRRS